MTLETKEKWIPNPLPDEVMGLIDAGLEMKLGHSPESFIIPYSLAWGLNLVLTDYGITPSFKGALPEEIREHIWAIIWDNLDDMKTKGVFKEEK